MGIMEKHEYDIWYPPYLTAWNLGGGIPGNSTKTFHRKILISQYFTIFSTEGHEAWKLYIYIFILTMVFPNTVFGGKRID